MKTWQATAAVTLAALLAGRAYAASPVSSVISPNRPDQQPVAPTYRAAPAAARALPAAATPTLAPFRLQGVRIVGSSLPSAWLKDAYAGEIGEVMGSPDLARISQKLAEVYATRSGFALYGVAIPAQQPQGGVLRIEVTESYVQDVKVLGPKGRRDYGLLRRYAYDLTAERPLRTRTLQRYVSLIRDIGGLNASVQFVQGTRPGGLELVITVAPKTLEVAAGIDNRGTAYLGRTQVELDADLHSLLREGDDTHLTFAFPTDLQRFRSYAISHSQPLGDEGATAQLSLGYLTTKPSFIDLRGHATSFGLQVNAPVVRSFDQSFYATLGVDGVNSDNALLGETISDDRTRAVRLAATYTRQSSRYFMLVNGSASFGFDGLGAQVLNPQVSDLEFSKYDLKAQANFALPLHTVLRLDGAGQYTGDRLPAAEQFSLGGDEYGRAYEAAVATGDKALAGSAELALKPPVLPAPLRGSEVYAFADAGRTYLVARPGVDATTADVASVGGGVRATLTAKAVVQVEAARGLTNPVPTEDHEGWRAIFSVKSVF